MVGVPDFSDPNCGHRDSARPFAMGVLVGLRTWRLDMDGALRGLTYPQRWASGENVAHCLVTKYTDNIDLAGLILLSSFRATHGWDFTGDEPSLQSPREIPDPCDGVEADCACGFYAYHDNAVNGYGIHSGSDGRSVIGIVEGYGRIVLGPKGFRCQKARIVALVVPRDTYAGSTSAGLSESLVLRLTRDVYKVTIAAATGELSSMGWLSRLLRPGRVARLQKTLAQTTIQLAETEARLVQNRAPMQARWEKCLARYPGVQIYGSVEEMRTAHPSPDVSHFLAESG